MKGDGVEDPRGRGRWAEALAWHETLQEAERDRPNTRPSEWHRWYADAENQRIFDSVSRLLADRDFYHKRHRRRRGGRKGDRYDPAVPVVQWRKTRGPHMTRHQSASAGPWACWLGGGFAVVTMAAIAVMFPVWQHRFWPAAGLSSPVTYQTGVGRLQDVQLPDGSSITLGGRTKLPVAFTAQRPSVTLIEGQAWFKVVHNPHWPFAVAAGEGLITNVGAAFVVTREYDRVIVTVTQGTVEVTTRKPRQVPRTLNRGVIQTSVLTPIRITEGEELVYTAKEALSSVTDNHAATVWTHGRLRFENESLRDVTEAVDRCSSRHIVVSQKAGVFRFSGIVFNDEIDNRLRGLEKIFPVTVELREAGVCIDVRDSTPLRRRSQPSYTTHQ